MVEARKMDGTKAELIPGMWYVGMNYEGHISVAVNPDGSVGAMSEAGPCPGDGIIAQYVGDGEFYDEDGEEARMQDYEYVLEQNMGTAK